MSQTVGIRRYRANFFFFAHESAPICNFYFGHTIWQRHAKTKSLALNARNKTPFHAGKSDKRPQIYFLQVALKFELKSSFEVS